MSEIVKKRFFRRCLYRITGAYALEQHVEQLEQQTKQLEELLHQTQQRADQLERHAAAQDTHRNTIDQRLRCAENSCRAMTQRLEQAEDALQNGGLLRPALHLFDKKSYSQSGEDAILMYLFVMLGIPLETCTYLDLGANHPREMNNTWFFYQQGASGILVDANPKLAKELAAERPRDQVVNACVGPVSGEKVEFHVLSADGLSAPGDISEVLRINPSVQVLETVPMETVSVNDLMKQLGGPPRILNLDIEGMEMEILRSIDFQTYRPTAMVIEMIPYSKQLVTEQKNQEILTYMEQQGYLEYAFTGINSIFLDRQAYETIIRAQQAQQEKE